MKKDVTKDKTSMTIYIDPKLRFEVKLYALQKNMKLTEVVEEALRKLTQHPRADHKSISVAQPQN